MNPSLPSHPILMHHPESPHPDLRSLPAAASRWALLLDFDSCIAAEGPANAGAPVSVTPETRYTLNHLFHRFGGAVALLTGRSLLEIDQLVGLPDMPVAAGNGLELRSLRKTQTISLFGGRAKSRAMLVDALMAAPPFAGRYPVVVGGSVQDESAFASAAARGGFGVQVGPGATSAAYCVPNAPTARAMLRQWAANGETCSRRISA